MFQLTLTEKVAVIDDGGKKEQTCTKMSSLSNYSPIFEKVILGVNSQLSEMKDEDISGDNLPSPSSICVKNKIYLA